jgi:hypothetical protein
MAITSRTLWPLVCAALSLRAAAAVPPPEQLLPKDTLMVATAPDWGQAKQLWNNNPYAKLWQDPAMKPFKDHFLDKFHQNFVVQVEQTLGIKLSDYDGLAQGQMTFAMVQVTPKDQSDAPVAIVFLLDAKDHAGQLKTSLTGALKKWTDAGKPAKSQKIRDADFTTLMISPNDLSMKKIFPDITPAEDSGDKAANKNMELTVGQSDSLLVISTSPAAIEKILNRQAGGMVPALQESPVFQADFGPRLRGSPFYAWVNVKTIFDLAVKAGMGPDDQPNDAVEHVKAVLAATGLGNITSASLSYQSSPDGLTTQIFLSVPEDKRPALFKILVPETKDAGPPPFVPADAVKFWRWRLDMFHSWKELEAMLNDVLPPAIMATVNALFENAGKDKDEHYNLKSELLGNLGDDIIAYEKAPKAGSFQDLKSPPALFLIGSPNSEKLAAAFKVLLSIPFRGAPITDREFLGRKIYSVTPPPPVGTGMPISFAASGGYLAVSSDSGILEEFLRSSESKGKALVDAPGLADAAQKVGGMRTGFFGYENENQSARPVIEVFRKHPVNMQGILGVPLPATPLSEQLDSFLQWYDFTLLPPFDAVSKYFYFSVYAGGFSSDGFSLKVFMPTSPQLRQ